MRQPTRTLNSRNETEKSPVPLIDISPWQSGNDDLRSGVARQVDAACREIGFLIIKGHSVPAETIERFERATRSFFSLPADAKLAYASKDPAVFRGYSKISAAALARAYDDENASPDFRETFSIGPVSVERDNPYFASETGRGFFEPNIWPDVIGDFQSAWEDYYRAMEDLAVELMQIFAVALGLEERFFDKKIDRHISNLLASNYPEPTADSIRSEIRAGAHTDYGSLTILRAEDKPGGLQVQCGDGVWRDVGIVPDAFVINIGDLMAQWTNDRWVSTIHRVVNPPPDKIKGSDRLSIAFFHQPNYDAIIECLPGCRGADGALYRPVSSGEHLETKLKQIQTSATAMTQG